MDSPKSQLPKLNPEDRTPLVDVLLELLACQEKQIDALKQEILKLKGETTKPIYGLLFFASFSLSIATISKRSCIHISGLLLRVLLPLALMDFRVFSSLSTYRPRRPLGCTDF
jgi:hypothetical protein